MIESLPETAQVFPLAITICCLLRNRNSKQYYSNYQDFTAIQHRKIGLAKAINENYASSHWLGTFAIYLVTNRGLLYL